MGQGQKLCRDGAGTVKTGNLFIESSLRPETFCHNSNEHLWARLSLLPTISSSRNREKSKKGPGQSNSYSLPLSCYLILLQGPCRMLLTEPTQPTAAKGWAPQPPDKASACLGCDDQQTLQANLGRRCYFHK